MGYYLEQLRELTAKEKEAEENRNNGLNTNEIALKMGITKSRVYDLLRHVDRKNEYNNAIIYGFGIRLINDFSKEGKPRLIYADIVIVKRIDHSEYSAIVKLQVLKDEVVGYEIYWLNNKPENVSEESILEKIKDMFYIN